MLFLVTKEFNATFCETNMQQIFQFPGPIHLLYDSIHLLQFNFLLKLRKKYT